MFDSALVTVRYAARRLVRNPGFALLAVLMLALGIASTTAVFSLITGVLLTPPPYEDPDELVFIVADSDGTENPAIILSPGSGACPRDLASGANPVRRCSTRRAILRRPISRKPRRGNRHPADRHGR